MLPATAQHGFLEMRSAKVRSRLKAFGLRREAKRHAALETLPAVGKRCRRFALPPQSKIFAILVTETGQRDLMADIPIEADEIEGLIVRLTMVTYKALYERAV